MRAHEGREGSEGHEGKRRALLVVLTTCTLVAAAHGASGDWPQFLGPTRNGVYSGPPLADAWPAAGPRKVWQKSVGQGLAGPVVAGDRLILFHRVANEEVVEALDAQTGNPRWRYAYRDGLPRRLRVRRGTARGPGRRERPRLHVRRGRTAPRGRSRPPVKRVWSVDTMRRFGVRKGFFGAAGSPLVENGRVIANIGGKDGGKGRRDRRVQRGHGRRAVDRHRSRGQLLVTGRRHVRWEAPRGVLHARRPGRPRSGDAAPSSFNGRGDRGPQRRSTPRRRSSIGDLIFVSATYETGAAVLRVKGSELTPSSGRRTRCCRITTRPACYADGYLFGFHGRQEFNPSFRAVELKTGAVKWSAGPLSRRFGDAGRRSAAHRARNR